MFTARMSEWSKEPDLRPGSISCVGSNPTPCKCDEITIKISFTQLAQSVERTPFKRVVEGSSPSLGEGLVDALKSPLWKWRDIHK